MKGSSSEHERTNRHNREEQEQGPWITVKELIDTVTIELHALTSLTQKLKLMGRGGQFTYIPTLSLTWRLPPASDVE